MSSTSSPTLLLDVRPRRAQTAVAVAVLAGVAAAAWGVAGGWAQSWAQSTDWTAGAAAPPAAMAASVVAACVFCTGIAALGFRRAGWLGGGRRIETASWLADGRWILTDRAAVRTEAVLHPQSRVSRHIVWLRWSEGAGERIGRAALLTVCDLPADDMRRLVARLRIDGCRNRDQRDPARGVVAA